MSSVVAQFAQAARVRLAGYRAGQDKQTLGSQTESGHCQQ
jgi:hypothetical protein